MRSSKMLGDWLDDPLDDPRFVREGTLCLFDAEELRCIARK